MKIKITLHCPDCQNTKLKRNAKKPPGTQNYLCKKCGQQFIGGHALRYKGYHSSPAQKILLPPVCGIGIRDTAEIEKISIKKRLPVLLRSRHMIQPRQPYYDCLEANEFWTYAGKKSHKLRFIYAYRRDSGEIIAFVECQPTHTKPKLTRTSPILYLYYVYFFCFTSHRVKEKCTI